MPYLQSTVIRDIVVQVLTKGTNMKKSLTKLAASVGTAGTALFVAASTVFAQGVNVGTVNVGTVNLPDAGFASDLGSLLSSLLTIVMALAALAVFLFLIWGAFEWITSGGDKGKTESARNKITSAVIGLIVLAASYAILMLLLQILGFQGGLGGVFSGITPINTAQ